MEWVASLKGALTDLQTYVKAHHTTGLVWSKTVSHFFLLQTTCRVAIGQEIVREKINVLRSGKSQGILYCVHCYGIKL